MDLAGKWDFVIEQGATWSRQFRWEDSAGDVRDLGTYTLRMTIRPKHGSKKIIATSDSPANIVLTISGDGSSGIFTVSMTAAKTAVLDFIRAVYDIEAYDTATGVTVYRILQGNVTLEKEVTTSAT
jgi:hypothetical protein